MKKKFAVFTISKDEKTFLPIWLKYYSKFVSMEDIYILDHESKDGSTDNLPCNHRIVRHDLAFDHAWVTNTVKAFQRELLDKYENVLFTEIDEIVFHEHGLDNYVNNFNKPAVKCFGHNILHTLPPEVDIDMNLPILAQRDYWFEDPYFQDKPLLSKIPLNWEYGYHNAAGIREVDRSLYLLHLNRFDFNLAYERNLERQAMKIHQGDKAAGCGFQKHLQGEDFKNWFYHSQGYPIVRIPDWVKGLDLV